MAEWQLECFVRASCSARRCFFSTVKFFRFCIRRRRYCETQAMHSLRVWVLAQIELEIAGLHASLKVSTRDSSPLCSELSLKFLCWPAQRLNSSSRLKSSFSASATTYDGEDSMNAAYRSSLCLTS